MTALQIRHLVESLRWLTWLISLAIVFILIGLIDLNRSEETSYSTNSQITYYPAYRFKPVAPLTLALRKGELLFTTNCQMCHEISDQILVGPGLFGVTERVPNRAWLVKWIKSPSTLLKSGDVYANHMVKVHKARYEPILMPGLPTMKEDDINALIEYIDSYQSEVVFLTEGCM